MRSIEIASVNEAAAGAQGCDRGRGGWLLRVLGGQSGDALGAGIEVVELLLLGLVGAMA